MHLLLLWLLADLGVTVPPARGWKTSCEVALKRAAIAYHGDSPWFDLWWKWKVTENAIEVRYTADVDMCGVYDDFRVRVRRDGRHSVQKLHDDGGDFPEFRKVFAPAIDACLRSGEDGEQEGGEEGGPGIAQHDQIHRTTRAIP